MYEIIQIDEHTWRIEDDAVRCFILEGEKEALMIDTGMNLANAKEIAESITKLPLKLINTHSDPDHISGNDAFGSFYMNEADAYPYYHIFRKSGELIPVKDGDEMDLGGRPLRIIGIPGHTPGSIGILDVNARVLISGDPIQDGRIFMFGPARDRDLYLKSLRDLQKKHLQDFDLIYPSHGSFPVKPELIAQLIEKAEEVFSGMIQGRPTNFMGQDIMIYNTECATFLCDK